MKQLTLLTLWAWLMASSFVVSGKIVPYSPPMATTGLRFALALLIILPVLWLLKARQISQEQQSPAKHRQVLLQLRTDLMQQQVILPYLFISASLVIFFIGMFKALENTTALNTSVIYTLLPLLGLLISVFWLKDKISLKKLSGFVLGSSAALILLFSSQDTQALSWQSGDLIFFIALIFLALHVVAVQKWGSRVQVLEGAFLIVLIGSLLLLPVILLTGDLNQVQWQDSSFWFYYLHLTLFTTVMTFILQQWLVKNGGANQVLAFSYTIPLWVALYNAAVYSALNQTGQNLFDQFTIGFYLGLTLLLLALSLIMGIKISLKGGDGQKTATK